MDEFDEYIIWMDGGWWDTRTGEAVQTVQNDGWFSDLFGDLRGVLGEVKGMAVDLYKEWKSWELFDMYVDQSTTGTTGGTGTGTTGGSTGGSTGGGFKLDQNALLMLGVGGAVLFVLLKD